jgi:site-specific DNA recombinase
MLSRLRPATMSKGAVPSKGTRCAVYTRKSSEEGLEQAFNSLHAQREACEAYVKSQRHEGWSLIPTAYDDGGWSGGNLDRPALQVLLEDIRAGKVDVVVVYKIDRLTRIVRFGHAGVQYDDIHGAPDPQCAALLRPIRARSHR